MKTKISLPVLAVVFAIILSSFTAREDDSTTLLFYDNPSIIGVQSIALSICGCPASGGLCKLKIGLDEYQLYCTPLLDSTPNNEAREFE